MEEISLQTGKKIYFASDFHLGAPNPEKSLERERIICKWLDDIKKDAQIIFIMGDVFDFWFEHKRVMPKGYSRFLGKLAELSDLGIRLIVFPGNHDMWMHGYFKTEFSAEVYREPKPYKIGDRTFYLAHGDGLGPGDYTYKFLKFFFENNVCRWLFRNLVHPDISLWLGYTWANHSWQKHDKEEDYASYVSKDKELLYLHSSEVEEKQHHDFYVFGHRHQKLDIQINDTSRYINLGDWIRFFSYAEFNGQDLKLIDYLK